MILHVRVLKAGRRGPVLAGAGCMGVLGRWANCGGASAYEPQSEGYVLRYVSQDCETANAIHLTPARKTLMQSMARDGLAWPCSDPVDMVARVNCAGLGLDTHTVAPLSGSTCTGLSSSVMVISQRAVAQCLSNCWSCFERSST